MATCWRDTTALPRIPAAADLAPCPPATSPAGGQGPDWTELAVEARLERECFAQHWSSEASEDRNGTGYYPEEAPDAA